jgi:outer membrane protein TolC
MNRWAYTWLLTGLCGIAAAQAQPTYSLGYCIEKGLAGNFDVKIAKNQQTITDNEVSAGNAGYLPSIDLNSTYSGNLIQFLQQHPADGSPVVRQNHFLNQQWDAGVYLNWTLFDGLKTQITYKKLKELQTMGALNSRLTIENFIADICQQYYLFVEENMRIRYLKSAVELSAERVRIVEAQYEMGSMSRLDFHQAKVDFNADSSRWVKQREALFSAVIRLHQLLADTNVEAQINPSDSVIVLRTLPDKEELWQKTLQNNTFLLLSEKEISINTWEIKLLQSQNYPYLRLNAGYAYALNRYQANTLKKEHHAGMSYGVTFGIKLFDGMNRTRQQTNAKIALENKKMEQERLLLSIKSDFANMWMAYDNNLNLINLEKDNLQTAQQTYHIAIDRYKLGNLSGLALREAQNSLLEAEERYIQSIFNAKLCEISLLQISGQISEYINH